MTTAREHTRGERVLILGSEPAAAALGRSLRRAGIPVDEGAFEPGPIDPEVGLVVMEVPVRDVAPVIARLGPTIPPGAILLHISPLMIEAMLAASTVPGLQERFVPSHFVFEDAEPAGSAADPIAGATVFLGGAGAPGGAAESVAGLLGSLGAKPEVIAPVLHDALVALTHQLPILAAAALTLTLRRTGNLTLQVAHGAHSMLADVTRPASAPSGPTAEALRSSAPKLIPSLENLEREVRRLRHALTEGGGELRSLLEEARQFRRELVA